MTNGILYDKKIKQTWFLQQGHEGYSLHLLDQVCFSFPSFADSRTAISNGRFLVSVDNFKLVCRNY